MLLATKLKNQFSPAHTVALKTISVNGDKRGCSGFISLNGAIVYVNTEQCGSLGYLYRTVSSVKDYTGGSNKFATSVESLVSGVNQLLALNSKA